MTRLPDASATRSAGTRRVWLRALAVAVMAVVVYAVAGTATTLFDRDEPRFAQATIEMIDSGNWLFPTFDGQLRPDKPILIYWLMSAPVRAFGDAAWALRLPSAFGIGIAALATFIAATRFTSDRTAILAMLVVITSPLAMMMGTAATADGWLLGMTTAAIASFVVACTNDRRGGRWQGLALLALFCGLAQLTKGPVALAIVGFPVLGVLIFGRRHLSDVRCLMFGSIAALMASVAIFLAWAIPANIATHGEFAERGIGKHVVSRILEPMEGHGGDFFLTLPYYIPVLLAGFFPWIMFLPGALASLLRRREEVAEAARSRCYARLMIVSWSLPTFVLMSLVATKLPHYVLPIWPALAIAVAHAVDQRMPAAWGWRRLGVLVFAACALAGVAGFAAAPFLLDVDGLWLPSWIAAALLLGMSAWAMMQFARNRFGLCAAGLVTGMLVMQQLAGHGVLAQLEPVKLAPRVAREIDKRAPASAEILAVRFGEPTLVFELWPRRVQITGSLDAIKGWLAGEGAAVLIVPRNEIDSTGSLGFAPAERFEIIATIDGFNYSTGDWLTLVVIGRDLPEPSSITPPQQNAR
jgi:4-amino-4-deoxy-L-arabinose transferase-like glycosyltransferase